MALILSPPNPSGLSEWQDGYTVRTGKIRSFKAHLAGKNMELVCADTVEVVRVRYGGYDHRQPAKLGAHLSLVVDPLNSMEF